MNPSNYRARVLLDIFHILVVPVVVLSLVLSFFKYRLGLLSLPTHLCFVVICAATKGVLSQAKQDRDALALGARPIPRIVGKWPGNLDVLLRMMRAFKTSYVLDVYLELFEEYQCTTLNTRILWCDNVCNFSFTRWGFRFCRAVLRIPACALHDVLPCLPLI
jgi:hypothetical protein